MTPTGKAQDAVSACTKQLEKVFIVEVKCRKMFSQKRKGRETKLYYFCFDVFVLFIFDGASNQEDKQKQKKQKQEDKQKRFSFYEQTKSANHPQ